MKNMKNLQIVICTAALTGILLSDIRILYNHSIATNTSNYTQNAEAECAEEPPQSAESPQPEDKPKSDSQDNDSNIIATIPYDEPHAEVPFYLNDAVYKRINIIRNPTQPVSFTEYTGECIEV